MIEYVQVSPHFKLASAAVAEEIQKPEQLASTEKIRDRRGLREEAIHSAQPVADGGDDRSAALVGPVQDPPALHDRALEPDDLEAVSYDCMRMPDGETAAPVHNDDAHRSWLYPVWHRDVHLVSVGCRQPP